MTDAPSCASSIAVARPIPLPAPVTIAARPCIERSAAPGIGDGGEFRVVMAILSLPLTIIVRNSTSFYIYDPEERTE